MLSVTLTWISLQISLQSCSCICPRMSRIVSSPGKNVCEFVFLLNFQAVTSLNGGEWGETGQKLLMVKIQASCENNHTMPRLELCISGSISKEHFPKISSTNLSITIIRNVSRIATFARIPATRCSEFQHRELSPRLKILVSFLLVWFHEDEPRGSRYLTRFKPHINWFNRSYNFIYRDTSYETKFS